MVQGRLSRERGCWERRRLARQVHRERSADQRLRSRIQSRRGGGDSAVRWESRQWEKVEWHVERAGFRRCMPLPGRAGAEQVAVVGPRPREGEHSFWLVESDTVGSCKCELGGQGTYCSEYTLGLITPAGGGPPLGCREYTLLGLRTPLDCPPLGCLFIGPALPCCRPTIPATSPSLSRRP